MHLPIRFLAGFSQGLDEVLPIHIVQKDILSPISPAHEVIHGSWIFHSHFAWHQKLVIFSDENVKMIIRLFYGLTPVIANLLKPNIFFKTRDEY